jgi:hypothetical protein
MIDAFCVEFCGSFVERFCIFVADTAWSGITRAAAARA